MSSAPSQEQVRRALSDGQALLKADRLKPSVSDMVAEGVLPCAPEPGPDGKINATVRGNANVVRLLQMSERHYLAKHEVGKERQARIRRIPMRGRDGIVRMVAEQREDISGRKHGAVRLASVRFGRGRRVARFPKLEGRIPFAWERGS